jgi:hypothetical protein
LKTRVRWKIGGAGIGTSTLIECFRDIRASDGELPVPDEEAGE